MEGRVEGVGEERTYAGTRRSLQFEARKATATYRMEGFGQPIVRKGDEDGR